MTEEFAKLLLEPIAIHSFGKSLLLPYYVAHITAHDAEIRAKALKEAEDIVCALWPDQDAIRAAILGGEVKE